MASAYVIRAAAGTAKDFDALTQIAHLAFSDSRYSDRPFARERVRAAIEATLKNRSAAIGFLVSNPENEETGDQIHGALIAVAGSLTAARATICNAPLFYVCHNARQSNAADMLLNAYLEWAKSKGAFDASVPVLSGHGDVVRVGEWLRRKGLPHTGDNFSKQL